MAATPAKSFFDHQDKARSNTTKLIFLFVLAVSLICIMLYVALKAVLIFTFTRKNDGTVPFTNVLDLWDPKLFAVVCVCTLGFIFLASLYKTLRLRAGGAAVAEMMGGRLINYPSDDPKEQRLHNIVEEMSLASGVPLPLVYVMDHEQGINAFAAGFGTSDAAVAVTRGTLDRLNRDELQGVIAHEFSHILNGDMRMNIRLTGVLFGILAIGIVGAYLMRGAFYSGGSSRNRRGGGAAQVAIFAFAMFVIGYVGTFVGRIIQAAVSRQREFLADSSAVQFTRNPAGIAGALKKIGGLSTGSIVDAPAAGEISHFFFSNGVKLSLFSSMLATHPPLMERIKRIDPSFEGDFPELSMFSAAIPAAPAAGAAGFGGTKPLAMPADVMAGLADEIPFAAPAIEPTTLEPFGALSSDQTGKVKAQPHEVMARFGALTDDTIKMGVELRKAIPGNIRQIIGMPKGAMNAMYGLMLDDNVDERNKQLDFLKGQLEDQDMIQVNAVFNRMSKEDKRLRLPLVDLATPTLRSATDPARQKLIQNLEALVAMDGKITLFEFAMRYVVDFRLNRSPKKAGRVAYNSIGPVKRNILFLLAAMAKEGNPGNPVAAKSAFEMGLQRVPGLEKESFEFKPEQPISFDLIEQSLNRIGMASYAVKETVLDALAHCAFDDETVTVEEAEILRVVSMALDCPLPPFVEAG